MFLLWRQQRWSPLQVGEVFSASGAFTHPPIPQSRTALCTCVSVFAGHFDCWVLAGAGFRARKFISSPKSNFTALAPRRFAISARQMVLMALAILGRFLDRRSVCAPPRPPDPRQFASTGCGTEHQICCAPGPFRETFHCVGADITKNAPFYQSRDFLAHMFHCKSQHTLQIRIFVRAIRHAC